MQHSLHTRPSPWPNSRIYGYLSAPPRRPVWNLGMVVVVALVVVGSIMWWAFFEAGKTGPALIEPTLLDVLTSILVLLAIPGAVIWFYFGAMSSLNQYPEYQLLEAGLIVRIFGFRDKWLLIPWNRVKGVVLSPRPVLWQGSLQPVWVIQAEGLPFWCRLKSWVWLTGWRPGLLVLPQLHKREELLARLETHIGAMQT
jgi:hypothetical protein